MTFSSTDRFAYSQTDAGILSARVSSYLGGEPIVCLSNAPADGSPVQMAFGYPDSLDLVAFALDNNAAFIARVEAVTIRRPLLAVAA